MKIREIKGLILIKTLDESFIIDLRYATADNFTGRVIYPANVCVLQRTTAEKLIKAQDNFKKDGFRLKILDAYRPLSVQQVFWDIVQDRNFIAHPSTGSKHNRGTAIDITLVDSLGNELEMPSKFDDFSEMAFPNYPLMSIEARKNLDYMTDTMIKNDFKAIDSEWWHFEDINALDYPLLDIKLEEFLD